MARATLLLLFLSASVMAKPPSGLFLRMHDLEQQLSKLHSDLIKAEEFTKKPRQERMILRFQARAKEFEGKKFNDRAFAEEILIRWDAVQKIEAECDANDLRILRLMPDALRARYNEVPIPKAERYQASKVVLKLLKSKYLHLRKVGIDCLDAVYGHTLAYRADASPGMRSQRYQRWRRELDNRKR